MIRLLIASHDAGVRRSLQHLLGDGVELTVVGEANGAAEAVTKAEWLRPDVVLLDLRLPDGSGIEACAEITARLPAIRVLVMGPHDDEDIRRDALAAGAACYVVKDLDLAPLREAILASKTHRKGH